MQPSNESKFLNAATTKQRIDTRALDTLIGICTGIIADGEINDCEIKFLKTWLCDNEQAASKWPGSAIARQLEFIIEDGEISSYGKKEFISLLLILTGCNFIETGCASPERPGLPVEKHPSITFPRKTFCFTGKFIAGTRVICSRHIERLGGMHRDDVTPQTDYLVIGSIINPTWAHSTFGRKIESAVRAKNKPGATLQIISEEQWWNAIQAAKAKTHQQAAPELPEPPTDVIPAAQP